MATVWRTLATITLLASLVFTVPLALWIVTAIAAGLLSPITSLPRAYWWTDYLGWGTMLTVIAVTIWAIYRLWMPTFDKEAQ